MPGMPFDQALADAMLDKAVSYCAKKKFGDDPQQVVHALRQGHCEICAILCDHLVQQMGEYLGKIDKTVKAVYKYEPEIMDTRPQNGLGPGAAPRSGINLVAWVDRKSAAFNALGVTLESMLGESQRRFGCKNATASCHVLDIRMVDDRDIEESRGHGMFINNNLVRSVQVWKRKNNHDRPVDDELDAPDKIFLSFEPELAPESMIFDQARLIESMPAEEREQYEHRLRELKVVLIRRLISDQLAYINIAKKWFTTADLFEIYRRKIGNGRIGGKAAGMLLAARILNDRLDADLRACIQTPESYFLGSDLIYIFTAMNGLMHWNDQKYKEEEKIRSEYPQIQAEFNAGVFPPEILNELRAMLAQIGDRPVIVRSSSLLEDNFGTSFAGKYDSVFCPNQGAPDENLKAFTNAISHIYASTLKPEALLYRRSKGLQDYDERMAIMIQVVQGERFGRYFLPFGAGVAFSRNLYRWAPQIRREDGFARIVWGLGTRAVERVGNDYPRLVALSHPALMPDDSPEAIRYYSQQYVDLIDLEENSTKTLPVHEVLTADYDAIRYLVQIEEDGYFVTPRSAVMLADIPRTAINFNEMLRRTNFAAVLSKVLRTIEEDYHVAVDMEFTARLLDPNTTSPRVLISILQCRPQGNLVNAGSAKVPAHLPSENLVFSTHFMVPQGFVQNIKFVLFVTPEGYFSLKTQALRNQLTTLISRLNSRLKEKSYICVGPGRWGTINPDLGVYVSYADIYNAGVLVELTGKGIGPAPDPSFGTHFFQDMMEAKIYPLAINIDEQNAVFKREFFYETPNCLKDWENVDDDLASCLRLIDISAYRPEHHLNVIMDDEQGVAIGYLVKDSKKSKG